MSIREILEQVERFGEQQHIAHSIKLSMLSTEEALQQLKEEFIKIRKEDHYNHWKSSENGAFYCNICNCSLTRKQYVEAKENWIKNQGIQACIDKCK